MSGKPYVELEVMAVTLATHHLEGYEFELQNKVPADKNSFQLVSEKSNIYRALSSQELNELGGLVVKYVDLMKNRWDDEEKSEELRRRTSDLRERLQAKAIAETLSGIDKYFS